MKKLILLLFPFMFFSCEQYEIQNQNKSKNDTEITDSISNDSVFKEEVGFAKPDDSKKLDSKSPKAVYELLSMMKTVPMISLYNTTITEEQLAEIKKFTDENVVKDKTTGKEKINAIYNWVKTNVKYGFSDPSAYSTFINKQAVCQGYANLFRVMCYSQNIPTFVANGDLFYPDGSYIGGHAWNYAFGDGKWFVVDPTNSNIYFAKDLSIYGKTLVPQSLDFTLWQDKNYEYSYMNNALSISLIKDGAKEKLQIPYSINNVRITNFNPATIPASVKEIYLGENIEKLGDKYATNISKSTSELTGIFIVPENEKLESYKGGIVYYRNDYKMPICIAGKMKVIELKATPMIDKNTIFNHQYVEKLIFAEGTKTIGSYAIESCPKLKEVYLPASVEKVEENAFYKCHPDLEVIRE